MVHMLKVLEDWPYHYGYGYERTDGNVGMADRQEAIDRFNADDLSSFAFLLSTRGCGQGITNDR